MTHTTLAFRQSADHRQRRLAQSGPARLLGRIARTLAAWRQSRRRFRAEAQLRHKLEGYNEHLLRDMGFEPDALHRPLLHSPEVTGFERWNNPLTCDHDGWR